MKKKKPDTLRTLLLTLFIVLVSRITDILPWWGFVVPVLVFGIFIGRRNWQVAVFPVGFLAGFAIWVGANYIFSLLYHGVIFSKLGAMEGVPGFIVLLASGLVGGVLTGLALYTGRSLSYTDRSEPRF